MPAVCQRTGMVVASATAITAVGRTATTKVATIPKERTRHMSQLAVNSYLYDRCVRRLLATGDDSDDARLERVERVARLAWQAHPGRFADGDVENIALHIGLRMATPTASHGRSLFRASPSGARRVLHVATETYATGGHSRVIAEWMQYDRDSVHALVLTRQRGSMPELIRAALAQAHASLEVLEPSLGVTTRATRLRHIASDADLVILHHHPDDTVPTVAFAAADGCPVIMFNHAHFWFSLGGSVADITVNTLPYFRALSQRARFARETALLHVPSTDGTSSCTLPAVNKASAKVACGLAADAPVILSIGSEHYYRPALGYDFFATLQRVLERNTTVQVVLIGPSPECAFMLPAVVHSSRVRILGRVENPFPYYEAADIVLESFPMPSLGAVFDAVRRGAAYPMPAFGTHENIQRVNFPIISDHVARPRDENEYVECVDFRLRHLPATNLIAEQMRAEILDFDHTFGDGLRSLYQRATSLGHLARRLPTGIAEQGEDNRLMAEMTSDSVAALIWVYMDAKDKAWAHVGALLRGFESPLTLLGLVWRKAKYARTGRTPAA